MSTGKRIERTRRPPKCPACGGKPVAAISYGMPIPSDKLDRALESGRIVLGGCCISDDDPAWQCTVCGQRVYRSKGRDRRPSNR